MSVKELTPLEFMREVFGDRAISYYYFGAFDKAKLHAASVRLPTDVMDDLTAIMEEFEMSRNELINLIILGFVADPRIQHLISTEEEK